MSDPLVKAQEEPAVIVCVSYKKIDVHMKMGISMSVAWLGGLSNL